MKKKKHISLFSGIGGFDLAADWMGWENVAHCEWNPFGQRVLKHYWPNAISYHDITQTDFTVHRGQIDILTGGFPCQPYSAAGLRKGKEDERHLWPQMLRAVREIAPPWVVGENVLGLVNWNGGMVFDEVQADLEAEGYEVQPFLLPAAGVNAPHRRDRIWFIAYRTNARIESVRRERENSVYQSKSFTNSECGRGKARSKEQIRQEISICKKPCHNGQCRNVANPNGIGLRGEGNGSGKPRFFNQEGQVSNWRDFPTQPPVRDGDDGFPAEPLRQRIREDCMGVISEKEIDKILSKAATEWRNESIKAGGNAIVPEVALQIFKAIEAYDLLTP